MSCCLFPTLSKKKKLSKILSNGSALCEVCSLVFGLTAFSGTIVQDRALKESGHECQAVSFDVGASGKGVEDRIGTTTDKSQSGCNRTTGMPDIVQSGDRQRRWLLHLEKYLLKSSSAYHLPCFGWSHLCQCFHHLSRRQIIHSCTLLTI